MLAPLKGYKTYLVAAVGIVGALVAALVGDATWQQAAAVIAPSLVGAAVRHGISTSTAAVLERLLDAAAVAADQAGKKTAAFLAIVFVLGSLSACGTTSTTAPSATTAATVTTAVDDSVATLVKVCQTLGPLAAPLVGAPNAEVSAGAVIAGYASGLCDGNGNVIGNAAQLAAQAAGPWGSVLIGELQAIQNAGTPSAAPAPAPAPTAAPKS
jgi:hypothetical protein